MPKTWITVKEASDQWKISVRRITALCAQGRISGAAKQGRSWMIPAESLKPPDLRFAESQRLLYDADQMKKDKYVLCNADTPVASFVWKNGSIQSFRPIKPELLPMQLCKGNADTFTLWIMNRGIDLSTFQHRKLIEELMGSRDKTAVSIAAHLYSIADTFTCFPEEEFVPRAQICAMEDQNMISDYILIAGDTTLRKTRIASPNISTDGSFTKTWRWEEDAWWLYKLQSEEATRSECEISKVLQQAHWDAAVYRYVPGTLTRVRSLNFVGDGEFFEPYDSFRYGFMNRADSEEVIEKNLAELGSDFAAAWDRIRLADALFCNTDRHMRNFGVIRSAATGQVLRLAPNFDNNQAYLANPGNRYSPRLLQALTEKNPRQYKKLLEEIYACRSASPYLQEAWDAAKQYLFS